MRLRAPDIALCLHPLLCAAAPLPAQRIAPEIIESLSGALLGALLGAVVGALVGARWLIVNPIGRSLARISHEATLRR